MRKLIGAAMIILASVGIGYSKSRELTLREKNLEEFLQAVLYLKGEIRCGNSGLSDAFRNTAARCGENYADFFRGAADCMDTNTEESLHLIVEKCAEQYLPKLSLEEGEKNRIRMLGKRLGYLDREMQLRQLELYEEDFQHFLETLRKDKAEKKKLYRSLGTMGGIMLAVLFW
ncbi:stage III sporulation protein AB [Blautia sp. MSJ-19]|uniref:stage III sporulation protein AB n=1 Tax=Blautia sp. MSJ-19 TaxID=2841517 RepID=UPI001C0EC79B|nr:stage III sporulation protein AB [Blautia sp. MSJ-19]MBU5480857.1 stage III sporulation protein AB [Blautia sp. MSJ-19]